MAKPKPRLTLAKKLDVDSLAKAFTKLTGRKPSAAEIESARKKLKGK